MEVISKPLSEISKVFLIDCPSVSVKTASGAPLPVGGIVELIIDFGGKNKKIKHQFKVIKNLKYDVILGFDFMEDHVIEINLKTGMVRL